MKVFVMVHVFASRKGWLLANSVLGKVRDAKERGGGREQGWKRGPVQWF